MREGERENVCVCVCVLCVCVRVCVCTSVVSERVTLGIMIPNFSVETHALYYRCSGSALICASVSMLTRYKALVSCI